MFINWSRFSNHKNRFDVGETYFDSIKILFYVTIEQILFRESENSFRFAIPFCNLSFAQLHVVIWRKLERQNNNGQN